MIKYVNGNIIHALKSNEIDAFAHGCNCSGGFGSGIAGQIAREWPHVRDAYRALYHSNQADIGFFLPVAVEGNKWIINCGTQEKYLPRGIDHVDYVALRKVMKDTLHFAMHRNLRVAMPQIGAGLAGGDWDKISKIVEEIFINYPIIVYVYP